jgi:hypothetical protein
LYIEKQNRISAMDDKNIAITIETLVFAFTKGDDSSE